MIRFNVDTRLERSLVVIEVAKFEEGEEDFKFDSSSFALLENWKSAEGMIVSSWIKLLDCNRGLKVRNIRT